MNFKNTDKALHFIAGMLTAALFSFYSVKLALIATLLVALAKEIYDAKNPEHTPDFLDAIVTVLGGMFTVLFF